MYTVGNTEVRTLNYPVRDMYCYCLPLQLPVNNTVPFAPLYYCIIFTRTKEPVT